MKPMTESNYPNITTIFENVPVAFEDINGNIYKVRKCAYDFEAYDEEDDDSDEEFVLDVWAEGVPSFFCVREEEIKRVILEDKPKT